MFKIYDESASPNEMRVHTKDMMNRKRQMSVFKIYDEPESPNEGVCLRYVISRNRHMRGPCMKSFPNSLLQNKRLQMDFSE